MTNLQAAIGVAQLERINEILDNRKCIEKKLVEKLKNIKGISFQKNNIAKREKITWLVCALIETDKAKLIDVLSRNGINSRPFFFPLSQMDIYKKFIFSNKNSIEISAKGINFPTNNNVDDLVLDKIYNLLIKI